MSAMADALLRPRVQCLAPAASSSKAAALQGRCAALAAPRASFASSGFSGQRLAVAKASSRLARGAAGAAPTVCATSLKFPGLTNIENQQVNTGTAQTRILCIVPGGTTEALLFYPVIDAVKASYPNSAVDVMCPAGTRSSFSMTRNVRKTIPYDINGDPASDEYGETMGYVKEQYYQVIISGTPLGYQASVGVSLMSMQGAKYGYAAAEGYASDAFAKAALTTSVDAPKDFYAVGVGMYDDLVAAVPEVDSSAVADVPGLDIPDSAAAWAKSALSTLGLSEGGYIVVDGVAPAAPAVGALSFTGEEWSALVSGASGKQLLFTSTSQPAAEGAGAKHSAPGTDPAKMAALISMASGVVCTNTSALQMARALGKPVVGIMGQDVADAFAPGGGVKVAATPAAAASLL